MRRIVASVCLLALLATCASAVVAQEPTKVQALVYAVSAFDGRAHRGMFYPPSQDTLYLLAGADNIVAPRVTMVYYWAITNEFMADWESLNEPLSATMEIRQGDTVIAALNKQKFVLVYQQGYLAESNTLYIGDEAVRQEQEYNHLINEYLRQVDEVFRQNQKYQRDVEAYLDKVAKGESATPPEPPEQPQFPNVQITPLDEAFVVNLPDGVYQMWLKDAEGRILSGSHKDIVVFSPRRVGISYNIIPATKWTRPEHSNASAEIVYGRGNTTLYMQPFLAQEYNDAHYSKLLNPQSATGREDRWQWVSTTPIVDGELQILNRGDVAATSTYKPYVVRQLPGSALGYEIVELDATAEQRSPPTFRAFRVDLNLITHPYILQWRDTQGVVRDASIREMRPLNTDTAPTLYALSAYPLALGAVFLGWRWRATRRPTSRVNT